MRGNAKIVEEVSYLLVDALRMTASDIRDYRTPDEYPR